MPSERTGAREWSRRLRTPARCELAAAADQPRDGGFSAVEILITLVLMGTVILPLIDAAWSSVKASATSREVAQIETVLQNAADRVNRAPTSCDYSLYVQAAAQAEGWDPSLATAGYQYYVPGASALASTPGSWASGACPIAGRTSRLIQMVTITVTTDRGLVTRTIKVVKSDV
jgi:Tfp pilus assembly protein PilV